MNFKEALQRNVYFQNIVYFQDIVSGHNDIATSPFIKIHLQTNMDKRPSRKEKGKALAVQPKKI